MGNSDEGEIHNAPACPEEDSPYSPTDFRWQACASRTEKQQAQGWWHVRRHANRPEGIGSVETSGLKPWVKPLFLGIVLCLAGYQFTKTVPMAFGEQAQAGHPYQSRGEQYRQATSPTRQPDISTQVAVGHHPRLATPASLAPMDAGRSSVTVVEKVTVLQADNRGLYYAAGRVNDVPVDFVLDSAAEFVTISTEMAVMAGIKRCEPISTDHDDRHGTRCKAVTPVLEFGGYQVRNVEVVIADGLRDRAVLGANVLRLFNIKQHGSRLFFNPAA